MTRAEHETARAFDEAKDAPPRDCHVCGDEGCRRPIVGCPRCDENMHPNGYPVCDTCDARETARQDRLWRAEDAARVDQ